MRTGKQLRECSDSKALEHAGDEDAYHGAAQLLERLPATIAAYLHRGDDTGKRKGPLGHYVIAHPINAHGRKCTPRFQLNELLTADPTR